MTVVGVVGSSVVVVVVVVFGVVGSSDVVEVLVVGLGGSSVDVEELVVVVAELASSNDDPVPSTVEEVAKLVIVIGTRVVVPRPFLASTQVTGYSSLQPSYAVL